MAEETPKNPPQDRVIIGVEPIGHYWLNLAYYLYTQNIPVVVVNLMHVKRTKELG